MKVLVVTTKNPAKRFLVELHTDRLVREVAILVGKRRHSEAIKTILAKGRIEREVTDNELKTVKADLILTEEK